MGVLFFQHVAVLLFFALMQYLNLIFVCSTETKKKLKLNKYIENRTYSMYTCNIITIYFLMLLNILTKWRKEQRNQWKKNFNIYFINVQHSILYIHLLIYITYSTYWSKWWDGKLSQTHAARLNLNLKCEFIYFSLPSYSNILNMLYFFLSFYSYALFSQVFNSFQFQYTSIFNTKMHSTHTFNI